MSAGRPTPALIDAMMRDFNRDTPGRNKNSSSTITAAAATLRRLEERSFIKRCSSALPVWGRAHSPVQRAKRASKGTCPEQAKRAEGCRMARKKDRALAPEASPYNL